MINDPAENFTQKYKAADHPVIGRQQKKKSDHSTDEEIGKIRYKGQNPSRHPDETERPENIIDNAAKRSHRTGIEEKGSLLCNRDFQIPAPLTENF